MEFKRYIFLDVDGVLNHPDWYNKLRNKPDLGTGYSHILNHLDHQKVQLLNQLKGCEVVISSSWGFEECSEGLPQTGLKLPIISGINARELQYKWAVRGNSIAEWFVERFGSMPRDAFGDSFEADGWWHPNARYEIENGIERLVSQSDIAVTSPLETPEDVEEWNEYGFCIKSELEMQANCNSVEDVIIYKIEII